MTIDEFRDEIRQVLASQKITTADPRQFFAHYTKSDVPRLLLKELNNNIMRQYDGDYMNDPEEGRYFIDLIIRATEKSTHECKHLFLDKLSELRDVKLLYPAYNKCTFLSCWTTSTIKPGDESKSDSLSHWRFYGDDGSGACIISPATNLITVFNDLYKVTYGINSKGGGRGAASRPVKKLETAITGRMNSFRRTTANAIEDLNELIHEIHPLLFLFKSSGYQDEQEVRSVVHKNSYGDNVEFDERTPSKAYCKSNEGLICNGSIIIYGPKADSALAIELMGLIAQRGIDAKVFMSQHQYR